MLIGYLEQITNWLNTRQQNDRINVKSAFDMFLQKKFEEEESQAEDRF